VAVIGVLIYPVSRLFLDQFICFRQIGIPVVFLFLLVRNRMQLQLPETLAWAGFLYEG
jgi:hypothetical protein